MTILSLVEIDKKIVPQIFEEDENKFAWYEDFVEDFWLDIINHPDHFQDTIEAMLAVFSTEPNDIHHRSSKNMIYHYWFLLTKDNDDLFNIVESDDWLKLQKVALFLMIKTADYDKNNSNSNHKFYDEHIKHYIKTHLNDFPESASVFKNTILEFVFVEDLNKSKETPIAKPVKKVVKKQKSNKPMTLEEQVAIILDDVEEIIEKNKQFEEELKIANEQKNLAESQLLEIQTERDELKSQNNDFEQKIKKLEGDVSRLQGEIISRFFKLPV